MRTCVGLWINQRQAILVSITDGVEKILHVKLKASRRSKNALQHYLSEYYREVTRAVRDARSVFIFGSAAARMALKEELLKSGLPAHRIVGTELSERMTEQQLARVTRGICSSSAAQQG